MVSGDFLTFSEWYHYAILILWIVLLFVGIRYMDHFDALFKTKDAVKDNQTHSKTMLITSFVEFYTDWILRSLRYSHCGKRFYWCKDLRSEAYAYQDHIDVTPHAFILLYGDVWRPFGNCCSCLGSSNLCICQV